MHIKFRLWHSVNISGLDSGKDIRLSADMQGNANADNQEYRGIEVYKIFLAGLPPHQRKALKNNALRFFHD